MVEAEVRIGKPCKENSVLSEKNTMHFIFIVAVNSKCFQGRTDRGCPGFWPVTRPCVTKGLTGQRTLFIPSLLVFSSEQQKKNVVFSVVVRFAHDCSFDPRLSDRSLFCFAF